ncbi:MAG: thioredoxin [Parachlamydiales bacterium]|nr:thioredoxin [Parachlamydiales bacterium]
MTENEHILTDDNFEESIKKGVALVDFYASWCGPCRMLAPIIEELAAHFSGKALIGKLDIDSEQKTAMKYRVTSVPTVILFKEGKEVQRVIGLRDAATLKKLIQENL